MLQGLTQLTGDVRAIAGLGLAIYFAKFLSDVEWYIYVFSKKKEEQCENTDN